MWLAKGVKKSCCCYGSARTLRFSSQVSAIVATVRNSVKRVSIDLTQNCIINDAIFFLTDFNVNCVFVGRGLIINRILKEQKKKSRNNF